MSVQVPPVTHLKFDIVRRSDLPAVLPRPAQRALAAAGCQRLGQLAEISEAEFGRLHGMRPKAVGLLRDSMAARACRSAPAEAIGPEAVSPEAVR